MVVGFLFSYNVYLFIPRDLQLFLDQICQITKFIKKNLIVVDDKIWGCLKTVITIHNYPLRSYLHPLFVFSVNLGTNMVFLDTSFPCLCFPIIRPIFSLLWGTFVSFVVGSIYNNYTCPPQFFFLFLFPPSPILIRITTNIKVQYIKIPKRMIKSDLGDRFTTIAIDV